MHRLFDLLNLWKIREQEYIAMADACLTSKQYKSVKYYLDKADDIRKYHQEVEDSLNGFLPQD